MRDSRNGLSANRAGRSVCPDQTGVRWHFDQIARATGRPIVLYNVPHRKGVTITPDTVAALLEHDNVVAIKECVASHFSQLGGLSLSLLCGNDEAFVDCLSMGGVGGILASAHVFTDVLTEVLALMNADRETDARALFARVSPITRLLFSALNPTAIKAMIALDHPIWPRRACRSLPHRRSWSRGSAMRASICMRCVPTASMRISSSWLSFLKYGPCSPRRGRSVARKPHDRDWPIQRA
ncbi:hypothetical protein OKW49_008246 [Paraburkholderia youngii]